jgi:protoheme IX farnesyltransferase
MHVQEPLAHSSATWRDYYELCKPRVVMLMILTAMVGMCLATNHLPLTTFLFANLGIALGAGAAAAINHAADQQIDKHMKRTQHRPLVTGKLSTYQSLVFAAVLSIGSMLILTTFVNGLTAILTLLSLIGYGGIYTFLLKHATPQNIVIGGIAGASPPLLGWTAMTGHITAEPLLLVLIIFIWTPPHFWALAIDRAEDYAKANVPMLPFTHSVAYTKLNILLYTILLTCVTVLPFTIGMSGWYYLIGVMTINLRFLYWCIKLFISTDPKVPFNTFKYSIYYLSLLFFFLLMDHYLNLPS